MPETVTTAFQTFLSFITNIRVVFATGGLIVGTLVSAQTTVVSWLGIPSELTRVKDRAAALEEALEASDTQTNEVIRKHSASIDRLDHSLGQVNETLGEVRDEQKRVYGVLERLDERTRNR